MPDELLTEKYDQLQKIVGRYRSILVAYSGGVDSALVMAVSHSVLGPRAMACIGVSPSYPTREMRDAIALAEKLKFPYRIVQTEEYRDARYAANPNNRCYFCKSELHDQLQKIAASENWDVVADGNNASDLSGDRPGMSAAKERRVISPLLEARITKNEVRLLARHLGLPVWDKPAMACLSSRVPHGVAITPALLRQIEAAEDVLIGLGFPQMRVRHHGEIARIEIPKSDFSKAIENHAAIVQGIKATNYKYVTLDLAGFREEPATAMEGQTVELRIVPSVATR